MTDFGDLLRITTLNFSRPWADFQSKSLVFGYSGHETRHETQTEVLAHESSPAGSTEPAQRLYPGIGHGSNTFPTRFVQCIIYNVSEL